MIKVKLSVSFLFFLIMSSALSREYFWSRSIIGPNSDSKKIFPKNQKSLRCTNNTPSTRVVKTDSLTQFRASGADKSFELYAGGSGNTFKREWLDNSFVPEARMAKGRTSALQPENKISIGYYVSLPILVAVFSFTYPHTLFQFLHNIPHSNRMR